MKLTGYIYSMTVMELPAGIPFRTFMQKLGNEPGEFEVSHRNDEMVVRHLSTVPLSEDELHALGTRIRLFALEAFSK